MRYFHYLLLACVYVLFTGCFDILETIKLNKNGSGHYTITYDMSSMLEDPMMKSMMLESLKGEEGGMLLKNGKLEMDTVTYFKDNDQFSIPADRKTLRKTAKMEMQASESKSKLITTFSFDFDEVSDIAVFYKYFTQMGNSGQAAPVANSDFLPAANFSLDKRKLTRLPAPAPGKSLMGGDEMEMVKMMMAGATHTTRYELPGKVKKVSIPEAVMKGNTVSVSHDYLDLIEQKVKLNGEIRYGR